MKKTLLTLTAFIAAITLGNAQSTTTQHSNAEYISLGPVIGFGDSWVGNLGGTSKFMPAGNIGIGMVYARNEHWGWGAQLTLNSQGYKVDNSMGTSTVSAMYLRPALRGYYFFGDYRNTVRPKIFLGPSLGVKLGESDDFARSTADTRMNNLGTVNPLDLGLEAGAGVNIKLAKSVWLNMDLGYYQGLTDAVNDGAGHYNVNHTLGFNAGLLFGIR